MMSCETEITVDLRTELLAKCGIVQDEQSGSHLTTCGRTEMIYSHLHDSISVYLRRHSQVGINRIACFAKVGNTGGNVLDAKHLPNFGRRGFAVVAEK